jgi:hypothetical protein
VGHRRISLCGAENAERSRNVQSSADRGVLETTERAGVDLEFCPGKLHKCLFRNSRKESRVHGQARWLAVGHVVLLEQFARILSQIEADGARGSARL